MSGKVSIDLTDDSDEEQTPKSRSHAKTAPLPFASDMRASLSQFNNHFQQYAPVHVPPAQNQQRYGPGSIDKPIELLDDTAPKSLSSQNRQSRKQRPFPSPSHALKESPGSIKTNSPLAIPIHTPRAMTPVPGSAPTATRPSSTPSTYSIGPVEPLASRIDQVKAKLQKIFPNDPFFGIPKRYRGSMQVDSIMRDYEPLCRNVQLAGKPLDMIWQELMSEAMAATDTFSQTSVSAARKLLRNKVAIKAGSDRKQVVSKDKDIVPNPQKAEHSHYINTWAQCRTCTELGQACDGERPCASCAEPGYDCLYPDDARQTSPPTANSQLGRESLEAAAQQSNRLAALHTQKASKSNLGTSAVDQQLEDSITRKRAVARETMQTLNGRSADFFSAELQIKDRATALPVEAFGGALNLSEYLSDEDEQDSDVEMETPRKIPEMTVKAYITRLDELKREINAFQEDQIRRSLRQARIDSRDAAEPKLCQIKSPFDQMSAPNTAAEGSCPRLRLHVKDSDARVLYKRNKALPTEVPTIVIASDVVGLPKYKSIGRLGSALLTRNNTIAKYNPYSNDDEKLDKQAVSLKYQEMQQRYTTFEKASDTLQAQRKCAELTELWRPHIEGLLDEMDLPQRAIVHYFTSSDRTSQYVRRIRLAEPVLTDWSREQHSSCVGCHRLPDGHTDDEAGVGYVCKMDDLAMAGLVACAYHQVAGLSLWHMALIWRENDRHSASSKPGNGPIGSMCLVCCLHNCSLHGMYLDEDKQLYENDDASNVDINDPEANQNTRYNVTLPELSSMADLSPVKSKKAVSGNAKGKIDTTKSGKMQERDIFYPCSHEGPCHDDNPKCRCAEGKIQCEYMCGCAENCPRRFRGCMCGTGPARVCFKDSRCACWNASRECDPWLCKGCGVLEVLDQANKYNDQVRQGRCSNNQLQLGLPARTIKAPSEVQGYGLFAGENLREHDFIGEYKGEIITRDESDRRGARYALAGTEYLFNLNTSQELDATNFGNKTRFMNNSLLDDNINVLGATLLCNGVQRVMLYAKRDIKAGDELLYNYDYPREISKHFWERGQHSAKDKAVVVPGAKKVAAKKPAEKRSGKPTVAPAENHWHRERDANGYFKKRIETPPPPDDGQYSSQSPVIGRTKRKREDTDAAASMEPIQEELAIQPSDESDYYESGGVSASDSVSEEPVESSASNDAGEESTPVRLNRFKNKDGRFGGRSQSKAWDTRKKNGGVA